MGFLLRWIIAFALLALSYNPTDLHFIRWAQDNHDANLPLVLAAGLVLLVGHAVFVRATLRSIGLYGFALGLAVIGTLVWVLSDQGLIAVQDRALATWLALLAVALMLAIGQTWAQVRDRLAMPDPPEDE